MGEQNDDFLEDLGVTLRIEFIGQSIQSISSVVLLDFSRHIFMSFWMVVRCDGAQRGLRPLAELMPRLFNESWPYGAGCRIFNPRQPSINKYIASGIAFRMWGWRCRHCRHRTLFRQSPLSKPFTP